MERERARLVRHELPPKRFGGSQIVSLEALAGSSIEKEHDHTVQVSNEIVFILHPVDLLKKKHTHTILTTKTFHKLEATADCKQFMPFRAFTTAQNLFNCTQSQSLITDHRQQTVRPLLPHDAINKSGHSHSHAIIRFSSRRS